MWAKFSSIDEQCQMKARDSLPLVVIVGFLTNSHADSDPSRRASAASSATCKLHVLILFTACCTRCVALFQSAKHVIHVMVEI